MTYGIKTKSRNRKSVGDFISENQSGIDSYILRKCPNCSLNDTERRMWIMNDEGLYNWARSEGCNI